MSLQPKRLAEEGNVIAAILFFWSVLSLLPGIWLIQGIVSDAGVVMAALYVVSRGVALSASVERFDSIDPKTVLRENARVALSAGVWFLAGAGLRLVQEELVYVSILDEVSAALGGAGLGVVALYAVAVGVATFDGRTRGDARGRRRDAADPDDETPAAD